MSKIQLSSEEMQLVNNSHWILTKHRIIEKVYHLLGSVSAQMQSGLEEKKQQLPQAVLQTSPKISKGELYEELPYVVLDYPRLFSKQDVYAVRSFFWWGNYFSITLHLKGIYQQQYLAAVQAAISAQKLEGYYLSVSDNEFSFNLGHKSYSVIKKGTAANIALLEEAPFIKLAKQISFNQWNDAEENFLQVFRHMMSLMEI